MLGFFSLLGKIGTKYASHSPGLVTSQAPFIRKNGLPLHKNIHPSQGTGQIIVWHMHGVLTEYSQMALTTGRLNVGLL